MRHNTVIETRIRDAAKRIEPYCLPVCLIVQALFLFWRLDLLPVWGDEQFTLNTSAQPLSKIAGIVRRDIHPPLYYFLVHYWIELPWSASLIVKARTFSGLWALASTILLHRLWFRDGRFLLLWTLSPCLIFYGRMGRSYTLQLFLGCLALHWGLSLVREPRRRGALLLYTISGALLLYTHYLPALAIILAVGAFLLFHRAWIAFAVPVTIMTLAYSPWLIEMRTALGRVARAEPYAVTDHRILDQTIRLLYLPVSFTLGESLPLWVTVGGALLAPAILTLLWRALQKPPEWLPLISLAAAIGYLGAQRWVSFPFIPGRLLFLLPFYLALLARRTWICAALLCLWAGSLYSYYHQRNFLNKGYILPFDQIAGIIEQTSAKRPTRLMIDAPGLDVSPLTARVGNLTKRRPDAEIIWVLSSKGQRIKPRNGREVWQADFVPYSGLDRYMMKLLGWPTQPTHVLKLTEYVTK